MIREILEQQGVEIDSGVFSDSERFIEVRVTIEKHNCLDYTYYITVDDTKEKDVVSFAEEQACRQYVKENGFKLEWLKKYVKHIYDIDIFVSGTHLNKELTYKFVQGGLDMFKGNKCINVLMNYTNDKLIAWLYANDIEIKE